MRYIKDVYSAYNPWFDNYGLKLYHIYEVKGIRFKVRYHKIKFTYSSDYNRFIKLYELSGISYITELYRK